MYVWSAILVDLQIQQCGSSRRIKHKFYLPLIPFSKGSREEPHSLTHQFLVGFFHNAIRSSRKRFAGYCRNHTFDSGMQKNANLATVSQPTTMMAAVFPQQAHHEISRVVTKANTRC